MLGYNSSNLLFRTISGKSPNAQLHSQYYSDHPAVWLSTTKSSFASRYITACDNDNLRKCK